MKITIQIILALALLPLTASPSGASANVANHVVISELQTAGNESASQEFVELYNPTDKAVPLNQWSIEYKSATSAIAEASWSKKATLAGEIKPGGFYLVGATQFFSKVDAGWSSSMAGTGGHLRLLNDQQQLIDKIGYGETANTAEAAPALAPVAGQSIERLPGRLEELAGNGTDTDNNLADFVLRAIPGPQATDSLPEFSSTHPYEETTSDPQDTTPIEEPNAYPIISVSELLIDPLSPLTDSEDEFIELHNPTNEEVLLTGYVLRCGSNFADSYIISEMVIPANGYLALYSRQTNLGLTNSGGAVKIFNPAGNLIGQTPEYGTAFSGQSWAEIGGSWQWTLQLTPGQANILASLLVDAVTTKTATAKAMAKKAVVRAAAKPKKATVKAAKVKAPKKPKKAKAKKVVFAPKPAVASQDLQPATWLIISLVVLTIGYALYEFRLDLYSLYLRARGNHPARKNDRAPVKRRGDD